MRILVIEDEAPLRAQLIERLQAQGYAVDGVADGEEGLHLARDYPFDAAIVDLGLPRLTGIELIQQLRDAGNRLPILILTARGRWQDKVEGLSAGGDDYLAKPFHIEELLARIKALLRRSAGLASSVLDYPPLRVDTAAQTLTISGRPIELTAYEYKILEYLMFRAGRVVSKTELTEHIYAQDFDRDSNVIEVLIGRLRRKIDPSGGQQVIETQRGRGYRFNPGVPTP